MDDDPRVPTPEALEALGSELEAQPAVLADVARDLAAPDPGLERLVKDRRRVAFVGLGSSRDACLAAACTLRSRGVDATVHMPSEPLAALAADALVVAVSASGSTPSVVHAVDALGDRSVVAITRDGVGPLADRAGSVLGLACAPERSGVAVWSFLASLVALDVLAHLVTGAPTAPALDAARLAADRLGSLRLAQADAIDAAAALLRTASIAHLVAPISRLGPALQAAQVLREVPRMPAVALAAEDWDHAHAYLTVDPGYVGLVSGPTEADDDLVRWAAGRGRPLVAIGASPVPRGPGVWFDEPDPRVRALLECPIVESIALRAWAAGGGDPALRSP